MRSRRLLCFVSLWAAGISAACTSGGEPTSTPVENATSMVLFEFFDPGDGGISIGFGSLNVNPEEVGEPFFIIDEGDIVSWAVSEHPSDHLIEVESVSAIEETLVSTADQVPGGLAFRLTIRGVPHSYWGEVRMFPYAAIPEHPTMDVHHSRENTLFLRANDLQLDEILRLLAPDLSLGQG